MIRNVDFDTAPIRPGVGRILYVEADGDVVIDLKCYRDPPGRFEVCGQIRMPRVGSATLTPSDSHFRGAAGRWRVVVTDTSDGDSQLFELEIIGTTSSPPPTSASAAGAGA